MFKSYEYISYLGTRGKDNKSSGYICKIFDRKFTDEIEIIVQQGAPTIVVAVIEAYEKRNLPVAANLITAICWMDRRNVGLDIKRLIQLSMIYIPKFAKYEKDIEKYLVLI